MGKRKSTMHTAHLFEESQNPQGVEQSKRPPFPTSTGSRTPADKDAKLPIRCPPQSTVTNSQAEQ